MDALSLMLDRLRLRAGIFTHASYCGAWAMDTSGQRMAAFHLVQRGACWLHLPGLEPQLLTPGDFVLFPRDSQHMISSSQVVADDIVVNQPPPADAPGSPTNMLCGYFEFQSPAVWPLLDGLSEVVIIDLGASLALGDTQNLIKLIIQELSADRAGTDVVIDKLAYVLFVHVVRAEMQRGTVVGLLAALNDAQIGAALNLLHGDPSRDWSLADLARKVNISRSALAERFRQQVGVTPMRYLTAWRMQQAVDLLSAGRQSVAAVAEQCGYQSEVAFRKAFKKHIGYAPGVLRGKARTTQ